jgi:hypothetical protein
MTDSSGGARAFSAAALAVALATLAACGSGGGGGADQPRAGLKIEWVTTNDKPGCSYDAPTKTVTAQLSIDGYEPEKRTASLVVTAYADENTSQAVGSKSTFVKLDGTVHQVLTVTFEVPRAPHVDVDGVAACKRQLKG